MKYAIVGDIHSNIEALGEVISDAKNKGVKEFICVGDIVGYGPNPEKCYSKLCDLGCICIAGNHDYAVCKMTDTINFNEVANKAIEWTREVLPKKAISFLGNLEYSMEFDDFAIVHSSFFFPEKWGYVFTIQEAFLNFQIQNTEIAFIGHSHVPGIFISYNNMIQSYNPANIVIEDDRKYLINVGSVGQPRDNNPLACYVIFDSDRRTVEFRRVSYNIDRTKEKIMRVGLPEFLAQRLTWGR
ncbi:metallophosphoesterase family protein [Chlamydiota bacterium]